MPNHFVALDDSLVPARSRHISRSVAGYLAAVFDLPQPLIVSLQAVPGNEHWGDVDLEESELDIDVRASIVSRAPNTIWLAPGSEEQLVRAVAHEMGHIAELLGYVDERDEIEEFPRLLANAVGTTYAAGVGWIDRLLGSNFYFSTLAQRPSAQAGRLTWARDAYWQRLRLTRAWPPTHAGRGTDAFASGNLAEEDVLPDAWIAAPDERDSTPRPILFPVRRRDTQGRID